jgi:hypothetical protein
MPTNEELEQQIAELKEQNKGILSLLQKILDPNGKMKLNLTVQELQVAVTNKASVTFNLETSTVNGKILYCALSPKGFNKEPFQYSTMRKKLLEFGWTMSEGTYGSGLNDLKSKGLLIQENDKSYSLPTLVTFTGDVLQEAT